MDLSPHSRSYCKELETATLALKDTNSLILPNTSSIVQCMDFESGIEKLQEDFNTPKDDGILHDVQPTDHRDIRVKIRRVSESERCTKDRMIDGETATLKADVKIDERT